MDELGIVAKRRGGQPIETQAVSSNLDKQDLSDIEPPTRQHTPTDPRPYIAKPDLDSVGEEVPSHLEI